MHDPDFYRPDVLETELRRTYDLCGSCRLCADLCPAFPALIETAEEHAATQTPWTDDELYEVVDLCYDCNLCLQRCPYKAPHPHNIDFPALMLRARAVDAKQSGLALHERILSRPDIISRIGGAAAPLANSLGRLPIVRATLDRALGVHRDAALPTIASESLGSWFAKAAARQAKPANPTAQVAVFATCSADAGEVAAGRALVQVLWHNGADVALPGNGCCGMPMLQSGDREGCSRLAQSNLARLLPWVERGFDIVVTDPTCSLALKRHSVELLASDEARRVAEKTYDATEYLMRLHAMQRLRVDFTRGPGRVGYHAPCHLRVQAIANKSRELLDLLPNAQVVMVEKCSVANGAWGMKVENFGLSETRGQELLNALEETEADVYASDCAQSRRRIADSSHKPTFHPIEILRDAYGL